MDIQRWFAIDSPKEMSESFMQISALFHVAETGGSRRSCLCSAIECQLATICDSAEWFASCMYLEQLRLNEQNGVRWTPVHEPSP